MLKFSEIFEFSREIPILKEFEWFEWFGPSPIEPFNSGRRRGAGGGALRGARRAQPGGRRKLAGLGAVRPLGSRFKLQELRIAL